MAKGFDYLRFGLKQLSSRVFYKYRSQAEDLEDLFWAARILTGFQEHFSLQSHPHSKGKVISGGI